MSYFHPDTLPQLCYGAMFPGSHPLLVPNSSPCLPPIISQCPQPYLVTRSTRAPRESGYEEFHHYYGPSPALWSTLGYPRLGTNAAPVAPMIHAGPPPPRAPGPQAQSGAQSGAWPEGFTLKGELSWGRLERVYGPRRELPAFVQADLRRVYGTYPRTGVSVTYRGGEYVVRGDPRVGEQEYRVERRVERRLEESPEGGSVSGEHVKRKRKEKRTRR